jgi:hypothetical protein
MSARAIRRAAERQALKQARQANTPVPAHSAHLVAERAEQFEQAEQTFAASADCDFTEPGESESSPLSDARLAANRANAQKSCGPTSPAGKAISSLNAIKTGLTGRTVLLPTDDATAYQLHLDRAFRKHSPATDDETTLTQHIADTEWRLLRIHPLEEGLYAVGLRKHADLFPEEKDPVMREALIRAEIFVIYRKEFSNLALQERRLGSQLKSDLAEIKLLQKTRIEKRAADLKRAKELYKKANELGIPFDPSLFGFVFSLEDLAETINHEQALAFAQGQPSTFTKDQFVVYIANRHARPASEPEA